MSKKELTSRVKDSGLMCNMMFLLMFSPCVYLQTEAFAVRWFGEKDDPLSTETGRELLAEMMAQICKIVGISCKKRTFAAVTIAGWAGRIKRLDYGSC